MKSSPPSFEPVETIAGDADSPFLLLCDHASNRLPVEFGTLGLPQSQLDRHIGYDIGARDITLALAKALSAPAILTRYSRLLIDPNRGEDDPTLVMRLSDGAIVPGNADIDSDGIASRVQRYHRPYHDAIATRLDQSIRRGIAPILVCIHSFTPIWKGRPRPWHVGVLYDVDRRLAGPLIAGFASDPSLCVGDNEPYDGTLEGDVLYRHATTRGLAGALIEYRQDLVGSAAGVTEWAEKTLPILRALEKEPALGRIEHHGSRASRQP